MDSRGENPRGTDLQEPDSLRQELLGELIAEATEHLDAADAILNRAADSTLDSDGRDELLRAMHSIKGAAGYMELVDIHGLAHALETVLQASDDGDAGGKVAALLAGVAELRDMVEHAEQPRPAAASVLAALRDASVTRRAPATRRRPSIAEMFVGIVQQQCQTLRAALPCLPSSAIEGSGTISADDQAAATGLGRRAIASVRSAAVYAGRDDVLGLLGDEGEMGAGQGEAPGTLTADEAGRLLDGLLRLIGEPSAPAEAAAPAQAAAIRPAHALQAAASTDDAAYPTGEEFNAPSDDDAASAHGPATGHPALVGAAAAPTIDTAGTLRVPSARVDALIDQVSEMLMLRSQLEHFVGQLDDTGSNGAVSRQGRQLAASLGRAVERLQGTARDLRLVRLETVFRRLPRICREAASHTGKLVRLDVQGGDTELDRTIADSLADPLMHLLRNAIDHGIEQPAARRAAGKPETGTVVVAAHQEDGEVVVEVRDDGRGIDVERIKARAIARGLLDAQTAASLAADDITEMLFRPGFSTSETVTEISGRGVGLDVVRSSVRQLGGTVTMRRTTDGTCFELRLPARVSATDVVLVQAGGETFAVTLDHVSETLVVASDDLHQLAGRPAIVREQHVVPLIPLADLVELPRAAASDSGTHEVIVTDIDGQPVGLVVDRIGRREQLVAKPIEGYLVSPGISAAAMLGDGRVVLVVAPERLIAATLTAPMLARP